MKKILSFLTLSLVLLFGSTAQGTESTDNFSCSTNCNALTCKSFEDFEQCKKHCKIDDLQKKDCITSFCEQCNIGKECKDLHNQKLCLENCSARQTNNCSHHFCNKNCTDEGCKNFHIWQQCRAHCVQSQIKPCWRTASDRHWIGQGWETKPATSEHDGHQDNPLARAHEIIVDE